MKSDHPHTTVKRLLAASLLTATTAYGGTYEPVAPAPAPVESSSLWNWFAGASVGYLMDNETEMYHGHLGVDFLTSGNLTHSVFLEVGYAEGLDSRFATTVIGNFDQNPSTVETGLASFDGEVEFIPVTLNYKLEGCLTDSLKWYIGLGAGVSFVDADYSLTVTGAFPAFARNFGDDDIVFTGQVFAGIVWEATDAFELYGGARYIYVDDPELSEVFTGSSVNVEIDDYLLEAGFRFNF